MLGSSTLTGSDHPVRPLRPGGGILNVAVDSDANEYGQDQYDKLDQSVDDHAQNEAEGELPKRGERGEENEGG